MEKIKILVLAPPKSIHTEKFLNFLKNNSEYEVHYITLNSSWQPIKNSYNISMNKRIPYKLFILLSYFKIRQIIKKINPHVIHIHFLTPYGLFLYKCNIPYIITFWGSDINTYYQNSNFIFKRIYNNILNNAYHIFSVAGNEFIKKLDVKIVNWSQWDWGINISQITNLESNRKKFGLKDSDFIIFSIRVMRRIFNIETIIKAFELINAKYHNTKLILLTSGYEKKYENKIIKSINNKNIITLNTLDETKFLQLLRVSNIGISLAEIDGMPVSPRQSMALGIPVIIYKQTHFDLLGEHNKEIIFIDKYNDEKILYNKIKILFENKNLYSQVSENAKKYALKHFDEEKQWNKVKIIYKEILE